jgi:hypothetical protein
MERKKFRTFETTLQTLKLARTPRLFRGLPPFSGVKGASKPRISSLLLITPSPSRTALNRRALFLPPRARGDVMGLSAPGIKGLPVRFRCGRRREDRCGVFCGVAVALWRGIF